LLNPLFTDIPEAQGAPDPLHWNVPNLQQRLNDIARRVGIVLRQVVGLPMSVRDVLVGVIYVFRREGAAFSIADRRILSAFAGQAAIAVHNARLYYQVTQDKRRLDAIIENSGDGVMILDPSQRITVFNRALSIMTGIPASEALGRPCWEILVSQDPKDQTVCALCPPADCQRGDKAYVESDFIRQDGTRITFGITYSPLLDTDNQLVNIIANVHDITHFREAEEMKSTFVSVISHELKTPVALIKGYANTLRREDADWDQETVSESLAVIEEESDRLASLIDNLLDVSRLQSGQMKLDRTDVRVDKMAERIVSDFRTQTGQHSFKIDFPADLPAVQADYERLRQVLTNLISNAIKYSPRGGRIMLSGRYDDKFVYVAVTDEGIGIPPGERDLIFERFYRVENVLSRRTQGAGLGLYLVKSVIDAHGGRIWVDSNLGEGSTFVFTLPREPQTP
jgi:PAS domain S-box-containing protein